MDFSLLKLSYGKNNNSLLNDVYVYYMSDYPVKVMEASYFSNSSVFYWENNGNIELRNENHDLIYRIEHYKTTNTLMFKQGNSLVFIFTQSLGDFGFVTQVTSNISLEKAYIKREWRANS